MAEYLEIEPLGDHGYLMRIRESAEEAEVRFQASTAVLAELNITGADEAQIVTDDQPSTRGWPSTPQRTVKLSLRLPNPRPD
jgi:hypothetical protein